MELTKKIEAEIEALMEDYWNSYFEGNIDHWANYLVDNYRNIGGTQEEIWNSKKEILDYTYRVIDQMKGATELRNKQTQIIPYDPYFMVHELLDIYIKIDDKWTFYQKFRLSSLIQKMEGEWKVLHQHGSYPDLKAQEGEAFGLDEMKIENKKLKDAIERRTIELEQKNRELEIEAALERVRSRSLAMHHTNELQDVIHTVHQELIHLKLSIQGGSFIVINSEIDTELHCWGSGGTANTTDEVHIPRFEKPFYTHLIDGIKKGPGLFTEAYTQQEKQEFFTFLFKHCPWSEMDAEEKEKTLSSPGGYCRSCYVSKHTSIFIINHFGKKFSEDDHDILIRLGKVFEQSYARFNDLKKAEAQAREAQIEAAVERVRAQSMAMHHTDDLHKVTEELLLQLNKLSVDGLTGTTIYLVDDNDIVKAWDLSSPGNIGTPGSYTVTYDAKKYQVLGGWVKTWRTSEQNYFALDFPIEALVKAVEEWKEIHPEIAEIIINAIDSGKLTHQWSPAGRLSQGILAIDLTKPPTEDTKKIVTKMSGAFNLAYQRFEDLQKAEAQAREAQINLAVERVRAKALAMFKSTELMDVVYRLKEEIMSLDIPGVVAASILLKEKNGMFRNWDLTSYEQQGEIMHITSDIIFDLYNTHADFYLRKVWSEGKNYTVVVQDLESLQISTNWLRENNKVKEADEADSFIKAIGLQKAYHPTIPLNNGRMCIDLMEPPAAEIETILTKMGAAFDLAYTRFEDLQKSEAQVREAQIMLALERVRSQAMAMQKSSDLLDIVVTMRNEFTRLGHEAHYFWHMMWMPDKYEKAMTSGDGTRIGFVMELPRHIHGNIPLLATWEKSNEPTVVFAMDVNEALDYVDKMISLGDFQNIDPQAPTHDDIRHINGLTFIMARTSHGEIGYSLPGVVEHPPKEDLEILVRFAGAFDIAHRRFLDLQKSEAQAREVEIELALEKVRSRSMGMQKSEELKEVIKIVFQQLAHVKIKLDHAGFVVDYTPRGDWHFWIADEQDIPGKISHPWFDSVWANQFDKAKENRTDIFDTLLNFEEKNQFYTELLSYVPDLPQASKDFYLSCPGLAATTVLFDDVSLYIENFEGIPYTAEEHKILMRFGKVFQQTYTRFLDLQKAEAQAREAQIEGALEKVRSRTMAMQRSEELVDVASVLFQQVKSLGVPQWNCGFNIWDVGDTAFTYYPGSPDGIISPSPCMIPLTEHPVFMRFDESRNRGDELLVYEKQGEEQADHYRYMLSLPGVGDLLQSMLDAGFQLPAYQIDHLANFAFGNLIFITYEQVPDMHDVFKRFAKVFEQTYTRFLDLKKAEAQAREAKIETALEKVRSRTMAMQHSDELPEAANLLFLEVQALGIPSWSAGYNILAEDKKSATCCMSSEGTLQTPFQLRLWGEASFDEMCDFVRSNKEMLVQELGGNAIDAHYAHMKSFPDLKPTFDEIERLGLSLPTYQINHLCKFTQGFVLFITYEKVPEAHDIFKRFTKVFEQTYTRFLDLKKAERQAREAQIENALEKVRSRSLSMQKPAELIEVAQLLREEMGALGVEELETSSIYIHDENSGQTQCWFTIKNTDDSGKAIADQMTIDLKDTWVGRKMEAFYRSSEMQTSIVMQGENRIEWIRYCEEKSSQFTTKGFYGDTIPDRTYHLHKFSNGFMGAASPGEISTESWELLKRATSVFSFAYTRFMDLQTAEASARSALRQASLDRVRADISSMRSAEDLDRITPLIFNELTTLGISFIRCGVFIVHEKTKMVEVHLATPEGKSLAIMNLPFGVNELTVSSVEAWQKGEVYIQHWNKADFVQWGKSLAEQGYVKDVQGYQGAASAPESLHLHFVPFTQGLLYVGSADTLATDQMDLIKALARAFSIAYARYEDFVKLEQAKAEVDSAMGELKATQSQLVQQEKLASLGQLTAGIAHEIKNPLNFVNNFSEVSSELIDEAFGELEKLEDSDAKEEIISILHDVKRNLTKVHEHGTRADSIVKAMLQHSRDGSGKMEPTDLNALIKEFVNLTFHGMRSGKNPIHVDIDLQLDPKIKLISLMGEDISRVILNLTYNAFDAMRETADQRPAKLIVRTKQELNAIRIEVKDNGPGIPDVIKDKILQPFFTTKKGTEGTGLGLSITHDIIKAHGGKLTVETKENEWSMFIITLPSNNIL